MESSRRNIAFDDVPTPNFEYSNQAKNDESIINLGLSLGTLQPQAHDLPLASQLGCLKRYRELMKWDDLDSNTNLHDYFDSIIGCPKVVKEEENDEEAEGVQSYERWIYVKVNMDGIIVGRKICMLDHNSYSSLALQLEDMFGKIYKNGLRLLQPDSQFSLIYKDTGDNWRIVGDTPWKDFVKHVKRIRITRKSKNHNH